MLTEFTNKKFSRLAPELLSASPDETPDPELAAPHELLKRLTSGAGIVVASWDDDRLQGRVHALGIVLSVDKTKMVATVDWRVTNFTVAPSPQGRAKWRSLKYFNFDEAPARRYRLSDRFADTFGQNSAADANDVVKDVNMAHAPAEVTVPGSGPAMPGCRGSYSPKRNRVSPTGALIATTARGTLMGNRADSARWLVCELHFERQLRTPRKYTKLFFLDEAVALSAGHRPCSTCRRTRYAAYMSSVQGEYGVVSALQLDRLLAEARNGARQRAIPRRCPTEPS
ncbi:hypothetical protein QYF68_21375 [Mycolicibacterium austroafricanum]|uniref:Uncharacterized protein n=1 Tax=Mycolicibacterium austroafricanum TaxID=39687 RepID=A0ABT8HJ96_MYCAO|nr:hypothetical protein [Mycolicibacterium austroafricanum]MDN4520352.1 hypothetical protein [Mycolicibacterium austroafricanum]